MGTCFKRLKTSLFNHLCFPTLSKNVFLKFQKLIRNNFGFAEEIMSKRQAVGIRAFFLSAFNALIIGKTEKTSYRDKMHCVQNSNLFYLNQKKNVRKLRLTLNHLNILFMFFVLFYLLLEITTRVFPATQEIQSRGASEKCLYEEY